ncbi:MAG TPA: ABC transporter permease subunit [Chloroflexota bacterium]|nr:ABC transporter permease subunit [Chloroflexota bacterium]
MTKVATGAALLCLSLLLTGAPIAALASVLLDGQPAQVLSALGRANLPALAVATFTLACGATLWALVTAVPLAWLVARTDLPLRALVRQLAPLPLAVPPYVAALAYALLLGPGPIYGPGGAAFVLGIFTAPSLFLIVYGALQRADPALEEAARGLGHGPWRTLVSVTLPLIWPAILAGALLVFVYACIDFGVVSLLRARTVTTVLYTYLLSGFSRPASAAIALGLVATVWLTLFLQALALRGSAERLPSRSRAGGAPVRLGRWRGPALVYAVLVLGAALVVPVLVLFGQAVRLGFGPLATLLTAQAAPLTRSLWVAGLGATFVTLLGAALALAVGRLPWAGAAAQLLQLGYAVPGTVLGLAIVGLLIRAVPDLYGTPGALVLAYVVLFGAPAFQAARTAIAQVTPALEAAARGLGSPPLEVAGRVILPLAAPGLVGGWALSFALAFRELAATIIIRPPGYDTLAVRIWVHTMDVGADPRAAGIALLLLVVAALVWLGAQRLVARSGGLAAA